MSLSRLKFSDPATRAWVSAVRRIFCYSQSCCSLISCWESLRTSVCYLINQEMTARGSGTVWWGSWCIAMTEAGKRPRIRESPGLPSDQCIARRILPAAIDESPRTYSLPTCDNIYYPQCCPIATYNPLSGLYRPEAFPTRLCEPSTTIAERARNGNDSVSRDRTVVAAPESLQ